MMQSGRLKDCDYYTAFETKMDSTDTTYLVHSKHGLDHDQTDNSHGDHDGDHDVLDDDHNGHGNGTTSHHFSAFQPWPWH